MAEKKQDKSESEVSEAFLRNYLAQGGKVSDPESGEELSDDDVDEFLKEVGGGEAAQPESRKEKAAKVEKATTTDEEKEAKKRQADEAKAQKEAEAAAARVQKQKQAAITELANNAATAIGDRAGAAADRIGSLSTTGGIALLVGILILLLFLVVQVNQAGDTRGKMLWAMVNGQAQLQGRVRPAGTGTTEGASSSGTDVGPGNLTNPGTGGSGSGSGSGIVDLVSYRGLTAF